MEKTKKFTLTTSTGCRNLLALFILVILTSSLLAALITSSFGKVKLSHIKFDSRGAEIDADMYTPAGVSDADKLPAVVVIHGGGVVKGVMNPFAVELSRRGFVVLNMNAYGQGLSEQPISDDAGQGAAGYDPKAHPLQGACDVVDYLRNLNYIDTTRIGIVGHSMGSRRAGLAAIMDCGYFSLNDLLINMLCNEFDVKIEESEVNTNADLLAEKYLDKAQIEYYNYRKTEEKAFYDTRIKSICLVGSNANLVNPLQTVSVGGYDVQRNCQVNIGVISGSYDTGYYKFNEEENTKAAWYTDNQGATHEMWYMLDDVSASSTELGTFADISALGNDDFRIATENRSLRICMLNPETHSKNFFSNATISDSVKYMEQTLFFNGGNLGDAASIPINPYNNIWGWRSAFNCIAMLAMIAMIFPLVGIFTKKEFFTSTSFPASELSGMNMKQYWIFSAVTVAMTFVATYIANDKGMFFFPFTRFWPVAGIPTPMFVGLLAIASAILLVIYRLMGKRNPGLNFFISIKNIMKTLLLALIITGICFLSLLVIEYLFNQDYRFWMTAFGEMKVEHWSVAFRYAIYFLPVFLLTGATTNYTILKDMPVWKDTLITVVVGSLGVWLCSLINILLAVTAFDGTLFSSFICSYSILMFVPITILISRKTYNLTHSIWLGAFINAILLAWSMVSSNGLANGYYGQTIFSILFGA